MAFFGLIAVLVWPTLALGHEGAGDESGSADKVRASTGSDIRSDSCKGILNPRLGVSADGGLKVTLGNPDHRLGRAVNATVLPLVRRFLGVDRLDEIYRQVRAGDTDTSVFERTAEGFGIEVAWDAESERDRIPSEGPLIVVANHPLSGIDALAVHSIVSEVRDDVVVALNSIFGDLPDFADESVLLNPWGDPTGNLSGLRSAVHWLRDGHVLIILPAGEVSRFSVGDSNDLAVDPPWQPEVAALARRTGAKVLPMFVQGEPSPFLRRVETFLPEGRTYFFGREMVGQSGDTVHVRVGPAIEPSGDRSLDDEVLYYRAMADLLATPVAKDVELEGGEPIRGPVPEDVLLGEIRKLRGRGHQLLADKTAGKPLKVLIAPGKEIPELLQELGRVREVTFRREGEGSGKAVDLDRFDDYYLQMILWDENEKRIAGGTRLGLAGEILRDRGIAGLYTSGEFDFWELLRSPRGEAAVEMGRTFIAPEYQGKRRTFLLLWQAVARFFSERPHLRYLMGVVSMSESYSPEAQALMMRYLTQERYMDPELARLVWSKNPPQLRTPLSERELDALLDRHSGMAGLTHLVELASGRKLPQLFVRYEELGSRFLGFTWDPDFHALDAFAWLDVASIGSGLEFFMGSQRARSFMQIHGTEHLLPPAEE